MEDNKTLHFETYEEAAEWFDTHDLADYERSLKSVTFDFDLRKNRNWVELDRKLAQRARELAHKRHISTRRLINELLKEQLSGLQ